MRRIFVTSLFDIAFKIKNGVYFIVIAFLVSELFKILNSLSNKLTKKFRFIRSFNEKSKSRSAPVF